MRSLSQNTNDLLVAIHPSLLKYTPILDRFQGVYATCANI